MTKTHSGERLQNNNKLALLSGELLDTVLGFPAGFLQGLGIMSSFCGFSDAPGRLVSVSVLSEDSYVTEMSLKFT